MRDHPDPTALRAVWALIYFGLGTFIVVNLPPENGGRYLIFAGIAYAACAVFLFRTIVVKR